MTGERKTVRALATQNVASVLVGVVIFLIGIRLWDTTLGVVVSAAVAALSSGLVWALWWHTNGPPAAAKTLGSAHLGTVSDGRADTPTLVDPSSEASAAYRELVGAIEGQTSGQVLLVSGVDGEPSTIALNLAVAATQLGRRVVLIDGGLNGGGVSRYSSSGDDAGLSDIALGETSLAEAAQVWAVGEDSLLPVITAGTHSATEDIPLDGLDLAAALDRIGERADLVLIDAPPITEHATTGLLAAHSDGSILVVDRAATTTAIAMARDGLEEAGAPVIGFITDEPKPGWAALPWVRMSKRSGAAFLIIFLLYSAFTTVQLWNSWNGVARESLDTGAARAAGTPMPPPPQDLIEEGGAANAPIEDVVITELAPEGTYRSFLLIGSDEAAGIADVILLTVLPTDGSEPFIVSLPRDLYVANRCTNDYTRINATLHGCGDINGPTALSLAVEDFTGITVDHFALFDFDGFADIVDGVGGVEICVENDRRDWRAKLDIAAGCTMADGATTLAWVRSRRPQEFVDGRWRTVSGASDLLRNQHQQEVVLQLFGKLKTFDSPADLANKVDELTEAFTLDSGLGAREAIALAWSLRALDIASINRLEVPVVYATTQQGQSVLRATMPFDEILAELYPNLLEAAAGERGAGSG